MADTTDTAQQLSTRTESDSMGKMQVPTDRYYGAQTARSLISPSAKTPCPRN